MPCHTVVEENSKSLLGLRNVAFKSDESGLPGIFILASHFEINYYFMNTCKINESKTKTWLHFPGKAG